LNFILCSAELMDLDSLWVSHVWQIEYEDEEQEQHAISNFAF